MRTPEQFPTFSFLRKENRGQLGKAAKQQTRLYPDSLKEVTSYQVTACTMPCAARGYPYTSVAFGAFECPTLHHASAVDASDYLTITVFLMRDFRTRAYKNEMQANPRGATHNLSISAMTLKGHILQLPNPKLPTSVRDSKT